MFIKPGAAFSRFTILIPALLLIFAVTVSAQDPDTISALALVENGAAVEAIFVDGRRIGVQTADGRVIWYDNELKFIEESTSPLAVNPAGGYALTDGTEISLNGETLLTHEDSVTALRISQNGMWLASSGLDNTVRVRSLTDAALNPQLYTGYDAPSPDLIFSPDENILVSTNATLNQIRFVALATGEQVILPGVAPIAFSPDSRLVAYVRDNKSVVVSRVEGIITERVESRVSRLEGHFAPITDVLFHGNILTTASRDGTISLWNPVSGEELVVLMGHTAPVTTLAFQDELLASGSEDGHVILWDSTSGEFLHDLYGHAAPITALAFLDKNLISGDASGRVIVWGEGDATALPDIPEATPVPATAVTLDMIDSGATGRVRTSVTAGYHPSHPVGCTIAENEAILAIGRSAEGGYLVYTESETCEGPVWMVADSRFINWTSFERLHDLPVITPAITSPRVRSANYESICASADGRISLNMDAPHAYPPDFLPAEMQASLESGVNVIICHEYPTIAIGNCSYLGHNRLSYVYTRLRTDDVVTLVEAESGGIIASRRFSGEEPPRCPETATSGEVAGNPPAPRVWMPWVVETLDYENLLPLRTVVGLEKINIYQRPAADAAVITQLVDNTPLNLIARSSDGDWGLVLLPDMTQGWVELTHILIGAQTNSASLPITDREVSLPDTTETAVSLEDLSAYRPLGRFFAESVLTVFSPNGYFLATIAPVETSYNPETGNYTENTFSLWDIRGAKLLWSISLAETAWADIVFAPDSETLFVRTEQTFPPEQKIRLTFFDTHTGQVISAFEDIDIYDEDLIPGSMSQYISVVPRYAMNGELVVVNYWRRAASTRCAIWDIRSGNLRWEIDTSCGSLNPARNFILVPRPYTALNSSYAQLMVHDVSSGAVLIASIDEVADYRWLDNERVIIQRPYGEPPIIWNVLDNSRAIIELPQPPGLFFPTALNQVMFYRAAEQTYIWDKATGELIGTTTLTGHVIEQGNRILVLDYPELYELPEENVFITATDLETGETIWRASWTHYSPVVREDGQFGYAYNLETQLVDVFDLRTGKTVSTIPVPFYDFILTPDWEWIIQRSGSLYTIWGMETRAEGFNNPPNARTLNGTLTYYEANTRFPYPVNLPPDSYLWIVNRSSDDGWLRVEDAYGRRFWIERSAVELLAPLEAIPIYE